MSWRKSRIGEISVQLVKSEPALKDQDFLSSYREYVSDTSVPKLFNEWAAIVAVSSTLSQQTWVDRGHYKVFPNLYIMLIGKPGSGKGTACNILQGILQNANYQNFAPDRTTKEKFLVDLEEGFAASQEDVGDFGGSNFPTDDFFRDPSRSTPDERYCSDVLILAEELSDFFGTDNLDFIAMLTKLWSFTGAYRQRIKTGRSVKIQNPCINMFAATTHDSFQITFPSRLLGTGFLARFILIYGTLSREEIAFPKSPSNEGRGTLGHQLKEIKNTVIGCIDIENTERVALEEILLLYTGPSDGRFENYKTRRFVQLLKISLCFCASRLGDRLTLPDIINANTLLYVTEGEMGKALGEFGKSRNSEIANKIMQHLYQATRPVSATGLWMLVSSDLAKQTELVEILNNLSSAQKIRFIPAAMGRAGGYLPNLKPVPKGIASGEAEKYLNKQYLNYLMEG